LLASEKSARMDDIEHPQRQSLRSRRVRYRRKGYRNRGIRYHQERVEKVEQRLIRLDLTRPTVEQFDGAKDGAGGGVP
jgi:hypothetical protein